MKTRIKVVKRGNGKVEYIPQYKVLFWWKSFETSWRVGCKIETVFQREHTCRDFLDQKIVEKESQEQWLNNKIRSRKVKSITYLKHPKE